MFGTRRTFLEFLTASVAPLVGGLTIPRLLAEADRQVGSSRYRVTATVTLFSAPVFSKNNVGSGYISIERRADTTAIQFGAGSWPESAHGLNRLGYIREIVLESFPEGKPVECRYFGFMTSSQEKSLSEATHAVKQGADTSGSIAYAAAEGVGSHGTFTSRLRRFAFPSAYSWRDIAELTGRVRETAAAESVDEQVEKTLAPDESAPATFLYSVRKAILNPDRQNSGSLIYNGKEYLLATRKQADPALGKNVIRLDATLRNQLTGHATPFRVWFRAGAEHLPPLRFDYQARSFLRLTFDADSAVAGPPIVTALVDETQHA